MNQLRIKIYTRSMNFYLYQKAMSFIDLPHLQVRLLNTTADGYLLNLINDKDADIVVNIDEDAFIFNTTIVKELIEYVVKNNFANCGMPDGGMVHLRHFNPLVTNPFFNIFNTKLLREKITEYREEDYNTHKNIFEKKMPTNLATSSYEYVYYEPYYPLLIWISQNFNTLYLNAQTHKDGITTMLSDHDNNPFLMHTWFSRLYGQDYRQTKRIDDIIKECERLSGKQCFKVPINARIQFAYKLYTSMIMHQLTQIKRHL